MKILLTGACGFAGCNIATRLKEIDESIHIIALDNLSRKGSEFNIATLKKFEIEIIRGDVRLQSDLESLPEVDWVIDCSANPSVLAGLNAQTSSRQLVEHNLIGTINLLEFCKSKRSGFILLSTSRVYSSLELANLKVEPIEDYFQPTLIETKGISKEGLNEQFPTTAPISLYGASKLASETLILEYGKAFDFPVWINRCGVLAGAGQFGKADQGIFSYWIHAFREKKPLKYLGFHGSGMQVRDALHPKDLASLLFKQMQNPAKELPRILNLGGGIKNSMSLKQVSDWAENRFGYNEVFSSEKTRAMDAPWIVMDSSLAKDTWNWEPEKSIECILNEIAEHAEKHPNWLELCS